MYERQSKKDNLFWEILCMNQWKKLVPKCKRTLKKLKENGLYKSSDHYKELVYRLINALFMYKKGDRSIPLLEEFISLGKERIKKISE